jgi:NAD(P)-dependent dehydrogenase (short-subunit alcohol dehydrogenase family)
MRPHNGKVRTRPEIVVITSASAGVGRATVRAFARRGAHLGLIARGRDGLEGARQDVEALGGRALVLPADVADADQVEAAAAAVEEELGLIDIWINNAMVSVFSPIKEMTAGARGSFDARARAHSLQLWADTHRGWLALAGLGLTGALCTALSRRRR